MLSFLNYYDWKNPVQNKNYIQEILNLKEKGRLANMKINKWK